MDIEKYLTDPGIFQHRIINTNQIPFSQSVADACKSNQCGKYGSCWTCPPGVGELETMQKKITGYQNAAVFTCKYALEDCFDFEGMIQGQKQTMEILYRITDALRKDNISFLALGCEGCNLCEKCTYPNAPCRFPDKAIPSVEACGVHVVNMSKIIDVNYNNGTNTVTYFCIIVF